MKDLNLLYVFEALWRDRSVTGAAENLGLTQAAVSSALKRMRTEHGDKMFTLVGRRMEPTPHTTAIAQQLLDALAMIRNTLVEEASFDPLTSRRLFTVRTRDIGEVVHLPALMQRLEVAAPHIKVRTVFKPIDETLSGLANGRIDFALGFLPALETGIHRRQLFSQHYVCVMRKGHPLAKHELSTELFCEQQHLLVEYSGSGHQVLEKALIDAGARHQIKLRLPQYLSAPHFIIASDLLWCAPEILVQRLMPHFEIITKPVPLQLPDFDIGIYWHDRYHRDPGNKWLRDFIVTVVSDDFQAQA
ncbi:LysR family transcriptional regulator [Cupriavidus sp. TA19]|uniref:LysR family transcriptional regulator n=1 Tax=unclassified Cupriavidus TaxID=2640874 RepID=UPI000E2E7811|nr:MULTISPECIES: LysR family transcriptional regulator [unclassified Cupriavidus]BDB29675.1 LysR family transcriptional regulator [Cupriavidus sp. P-10]GLC91261.1 LysR family transcriptional regulator [Cupriavidus sp. TA19]